METQFVRQTDVRREPRRPIETTLRDKKVYIVGLRKLTNEMLAYFLEKETSAECEILSSPAELPKGNDGLEFFNNLVLLDWPDEDIDKYLLRPEPEAKAVTAEYPFALFNVPPNRGYEKQAVMNGVRGFFYEQDPQEMFIKGINILFKGEMWLSREIMAKCIEANRAYGNNSRRDVVILTQRELEILTMVVGGATNEDIGKKLCISAHTVKTHIYNIFKKISVPNRLQAALWAAKNL